MHSAVWAAAAAWAAAVASEVVADSIPALQAALEDLRLHAPLLLRLPLGLSLPGLSLPGLLLPDLSLHAHSRPAHLRRGHLRPQGRTYSRIPLEALFHSRAGQTGLCASATTDSSLTTGSSSITDFL